MNSATLSEILLTFRCTRVIEAAEEVCRNSDEVETRRSEFHEPFKPIVCRLSVPEEARAVRDMVLESRSGSSYINRSL